MSSFNKLCKGRPSSEDAEKRITEEIRCLCLKKGIRLKDVDTMRQLRQCCGIDISAVVAAIVH